jgi:hypothetical protein
MGVRPPRRLPGAVQVERYYQDVFLITRGLPLSVVVLVAGVLRSKELPASGTR